MKKQEKFYTEEQKEIRSFVRILTVILVIFLGLYIYGSIKGDNKNKIERTNKAGTVNYETLIVGTMLSKPDKEYYVLAFDSNSLDNNYIVTLANSYKSSTKALPVYTIDLSSEFNKSYVASESAYDKEDLSLIKFKSTTLVKVVDGKISKFIEDEDTIIKELKTV